MQTHIILGFIMLFLAIYFTQLEIRKLQRIRTSTGILQLVFHILVILLFMTDFFDADIFTSVTKEDGI